MKKKEFKTQSQRRIGMKMTNSEGDNFKLEGEKKDKILDGHQTKKVSSNGLEMYAALFSMECGLATHILPQKCVRCFIALWVVYMYTVLHTHMADNTPVLHTAERPSITKKPHKCP